MRRCGEPHLHGENERVVNKVIKEAKQRTWGREVALQGLPFHQCLAHLHPPASLGSFHTSQSERHWLSESLTVVLLRSFQKVFVTSLRICRSGPCAGSIDSFQGGGKTSDTQSGKENKQDRSSETSLACPPCVFTRARKSLKSQQNLTLYSVFMEAHCFCLHTVF